MHSFKIALIRFLDKGCYYVDHFPHWTYNFVGRWIGCPRGMALWAFALINHWDIHDIWLDKGPQPWDNYEEESE